MIIEIVKPYISSGQRIITLDNITIILQKDETNELFEELDNELNYGETRTELKRKINDLESEVRILERELGLR